MQYLYPVWFFFAAVFSYFAYVHWRLSSTAIRPFKTRGVEEGKASEASALISEFVHDFNSYLETVNGQNRAMNRNATVGFFVAAVVSIIALFLSAPRIGG
ncbi:MAG TPA: hypothetical protein VFI11_00815 [Anaerolineales bacterium]|nr:hypothetical protein [Anaerolineales bacterium]